MEYENEDSMIKREYSLFSTDVVPLRGFDRSTFTPPCTE